MRRWESVGLVVALSAATLGPGCGTKQRNFASSDATAGTSGATAGTSDARAGTGGTGEAAEGGAGAEGGTAPVDGGAAATIQPDCAFNQTTCIGNAPATCSAGTWVVADECSGALPACSNGTCASARVVGGIVTVVPVTGADGAVRVVEQSFNIARTSCGLVAGEQVCVTGGIKP